MLHGRDGTLGTGAVGWGACCVLAALAATVVVDTVMWCPPEGATGAFWPGATGIFWPEGRVLWFNTAENRSGEWGRSPPHWYFTSALPRALLLAYPLAFLGAAMERRVRAPLVCAMFYVGAYSFLPHKELRFIFPALPLMNAAAAAAAGRVWINRGKIFSRRASGPTWTLLAAGIVGGGLTTRPSLHHGTFSPFLLLFITEKRFFFFLRVPLGFGSVASAKSVVT